MIRVDTSKIENWEEIKKRHSEWCTEEVYPKVYTVYKELKKIIKPSKNTQNYIKILSKIVVNKNNGISNFWTKEELDLYKLDIEGIKKELENNLSKLDFKNKNIETKISKIINKSRQDKDDYKQLKINLKREIQSIDEEVLDYIYKKNPVSKIKDIINITKVQKLAYEIESITDLLPHQLFNYENKFAKKSKEKSNGWGRHSLLTMMGLEVCPYCQRNYITNYNHKDSILTTADLDHFYPQSQYPYLALSLYNFIPSCHTCNSTMKNRAEIGINTHIYPYTDSMEEDIKFTIETDSFMDNIFTKNQNLNIDINVNNSISADKKEKIKNSLKTFKLREVYKNSHSKYVGDLIHNFQKYPKSYTKALGEIFLDKDKEDKIYQEKLQILNDNFQEIIKKPYTDKIEKGEPLAKLTKDIMEELGIK